MGRALFDAVVTSSDTSLVSESENDLWRLIFLSSGEWLSSEDEVEELWGVFRFVGSAW